MVGRIQRNKAGSLARWAHTAHSVDSSRLVTALDRAVVAALAEHRRGERLRVYVQVSLDGDGSRGGVDSTTPGAVDRICAQVQESEGLELVGLMGIPPLDWDPDGPLTGCNRSTTGCVRCSRTRSVCRRACPTTLKSPSNMVRPVCVSVPRYWVRGGYGHRE